MNIYDFNAKDNKGHDVSLADFKGKVLLVVNTATKCGLTPQYEQLEPLYKKFHDQGFEILDFPCNQFKEQAPESDEEINNFCQLNYGTTFPRFQKIDVNGENTHPLFAWLKSEFPEDKGTDETKIFEERVKKYTPDQQPGDIKWNFGKFLLDTDGKIVNRYSPAFAPEELEEDIKQLLGK